MRRVAILGAVLGLASCEPGCLRAPLGQVGTLPDGTEFSPTSTVFAVLDEYEDPPLHADGGFALRKRETPLLKLVFTRAPFDPEVDLASLPVTERADLVHEVETQHSLLIEGIPVDADMTGAVFDAHRPPISGAFTFVARRPTVLRTPNGTYTQDKPLGADQTVRITFGTGTNVNNPLTFLRRVNVDDLQMDFRVYSPLGDGGVLPDAAIPDAAIPDAAVPDAAIDDGGALDAAVMDDGGIADASTPDAAPLADAAVSDAAVDADAAVAVPLPPQNEAVSTGTLKFAFSIPLVAERLGESNLAILRDALTAE